MSRMYSLSVISNKIYHLFTSFDQLMSYSYYGGRIFESLRDEPNSHVLFHLRNEHYDHCTKHGIDGKILKRGCVHFIDYVIL